MSRLHTFLALPALLILGSVPAGASELLLNGNLNSTVQVGDPSLYYPEFTGWTIATDPCSFSPCPISPYVPGAFYTQYSGYPAGFADRLGGGIAVFGSGAEQAMCADVATAARGMNLAGKTTLREFIDMTAACGFFLTNDSGAMHIAAALRIPSITVFGPTDEIATGPSSSSAHLVREPVECAPCKLRECPIDHRCMTRVSADRVVSEALRIIQH